MKKIKSILAILSALAMSLGCLSVPTMAESHEKWDDGTYKYGKYIDINEKTTYEVIGYVGTIPEDGTLYFPAKNSKGNKITEVYSTRRFLDDSGAWLKKIVIPNGYNTIMGLNNIEGLEEVVLPSSVQYIGLHAFYGCMNLKKNQSDTQH